MKYVYSEGVVLRQKSPLDPFYEIYRDGEWVPYESPTAEREWYEGSPITKAEAKKLRS